MSGEAWRSQTFANDGGPLIAITHELVGHWPGTRNDYDRACDARCPFDFFPAGPGFVVVANGPQTMLYTAYWLRLPGQPGITLVGWDYGPADAEHRLLSRLAQPGIDWHRHRQQMTIMTGVLLLQHAAGNAADVGFAPADQLACIGHVVPVGIEPGQYTLETVTLEEGAGDEQYCCVLCRWIPAGRAGRSLIQEPAEAVASRAEK